jgi:hypothetical protein
MRELLWYEQFVPFAWIRSYADSADVLRDLSFEHELRQLHTLYYDQRDMKKAWNNLAVMKKRFIADDPSPVSPRQEARFYHLAGQIAFGNREWEDAREYMILAYDQVSPKNWVSKLEAARWSATIHFVLEDHRFASEMAQEVLASLKQARCSVIIKPKYRLKLGKQKRRPHFKYGEYDNFVLSMRFFQAQSLHGNGDFAASLDALDDCLAYVHSWFMHHLHIARRHTLRSFTQMYRHNPTGIPVLSLEKLLLSRHALRQSKMHKKMIESYCKILWQRAMTLYWREKLDPHPDILYSFEELRSAFRLLNDLIAACQNVPIVTTMIPTMHRAQADIALLLSTFQTAKLPLAYHWLHAFYWLELAEDSLSLAEGLDVLAKEILYQESSDAGKLLLDQIKLRRYEIVEDRLGGEQLLLSVLSFYHKAKESRKRHLEGLCCLLIGKLYAELGRDPLAKRYFIAALAIFKQEGNTLRAIETQRELEALDDH